MRSVVVGAVMLVGLGAALPVRAHSAEKPAGGAAQKANGAKPEVVWANAEVGVTHVALASFAMNDLIESNPYWQRSGPLYGTALGLRLDAMTVGMRARHGTSHAFDHWSLGAEAAYRPLRDGFVPHVGLGIGYVEVDNLVTVSVDGADFRFWEARPIRGLGTRLIGGLDFRFASVLSAGVAVSGELLFLSRRASPGAPAGSLDARDGSSTGGAVAATAVLGLHI